MVMDIPPLLVTIVKRYEGFARIAMRRPIPTAVPYLCPAGFWTIGYGELCQRDTPMISEPEAALRLEQVLLPVYMAHALRLSPKLAKEPSRRLVAITDFIYNLGPTRYAASTLRRRVDAEDWSRAAGELSKWVWGGGVKLPGLILRRGVEAVLLT